jgi:hypothetical protein
MLLLLALKPEDKEEKSLVRSEILEHSFEYDYSFKTEESCLAHCVMIRASTSGADTQKMRIRRAEI